MANIRKTASGGERTEIDRLVAVLGFRNRQASYAATSSGAIANGTTAGKLKTAAACSFKIAGVLYAKAIADDLWDLSAKTDTIAAQYRAYALYLDANGAATLGDGANAASVAAALLALPAFDATKAVIGVYVAGPSTDFNAAGGLAAQGTIYNGLPDGVSADGGPIVQLNR